MGDLTIALADAKGSARTPSPRCASAPPEACRRSNISRGRLPRPGESEGKGSDSSPLRSSSWYQSSVLCSGCSVTPASSSRQIAFFPWQTRAPAGIHIRPDHPGTIQQTGKCPVRSRFSLHGTVITPLADLSLLSGGGLGVIHLLLVVYPLVPTTVTRTGTPSRSQNSFGLISCRVSPDPVTHAPPCRAEDPGRQPGARIFSFFPSTLYIGRNSDTRMGALYIYSPGPSPHVPVVRKDRKTSCNSYQLTLLRHFKRHSSLISVHLYLFTLTYRIARLSGDIIAVQTVPVSSPLIRLDTTGPAVPDWRFL